MARIMVDIEQKGAAPTLEEIKRSFGLSNEEVDADFDVVQTEPDINPDTYTILVDEKALSKLNLSDAIAPQKDGLKVKRASSNPRIEPTGPPR